MTLPRNIDRPTSHRPSRLMLRGYLPRHGWGRELLLFVLLAPVGALFVFLIFVSILFVAAFDCIMSLVCERRTM